jgi:ribosomal protein S18 acetylase RimI-like enzyme
MGLLILDPQERGKGLGRKAAEQVIEEAKLDLAPRIRIAVLDKNPRGRKFWESLGFKLEKTVLAEDNDDGNERHVLVKEL